ncbi:MAG TPA: NADP-dependent phosphogluconate dehydrogenase [Oscillatoriaceae cyanobacterium]
MGLGKMGGNLGIQARRKGMRVVGVTRPPIRPELGEAGVEVVADLRAMREALAPPRKIYLSVPAGPAVDAVLTELRGVLAAGDIVMDGGNSHYQDSARRHAFMAENGIFYLDVGTSGGPGGALNGACFMVGGDRQAFEQVQAMLEALAVPEGVVYVGPPGAGHYVKLVHNGIEFGMLQAIGEGVALLKQGPFALDLLPILHNWNHGSVIRSWLVELLEEGLRSGVTLEEVPGHVEDTGEVNWLVQDAARMEIAIPVIAQAVWQLIQSRQAQNLPMQAVSLMRHQFGGHPFGPFGPIAEERKVGRVTWDPFHPAPEKRS